MQNNFDIPKIDQNISLYKKSFYNIQVKTESGMRLFNSRSGAIVDFDLNDLQFSDFEKIWRRKNFKLSEHEWFAILINLGFIVPRDIDEIEDYLASFNLRQNSHESLHFILMPTEQCNFRCIYCYETFLKSKMNNKTQAALIKHMQQILPSLKYLSVEWFGSEPFLALDVIEKISKIAIKTAEEFGVCYQAAATTNGFFLTPDVFEKVLKVLNEYRINRFAVTIDGPETYHNQRRILESGKGTYEQILSNMEYIITTDYQNLQFIIRMNVDRENLHTVPEFMKIIKNIVKEDKRFFFYTRPVWGKSRFNLLSSSEERHLFKSVTELCKSLKIRWYDTELYLNPNIGGCYAADPHSFVIGSDGLIYKCTSAFDMPENQVGIVNTDGSLALDDQKLKLWVKNRADEYKSCRSCTLLPLCNGAHCPRNELMKIQLKKGRLQKLQCPSTKLSIKNIVKAASIDNV